jgi:hypothetical protein
MNLIQYSDSLPADCRLRKDHKDAIFASDCYHLVAWRWALFGPKNEPHSAGKARERTQIADAQLQVRLWFCQYREDHKIKDAVAATLRPHFTLAMRSLLPIFRSKWELSEPIWVDQKPIKKKERIQRNDTLLRTHIAGLESVDKSPHNFLLMCHVLHLSRPAENPSPKTHKQTRKPL